MLLHNHCSYSSTYFRDFTAVTAIVSVIVRDSTEW
jgi:hypothetical protein